MRTSRQNSLWYNIQLCLLLCHQVTTLRWSTIFNDSPYIMKVLSLMALLMHIFQVAMMMQVTMTSMITPWSLGRGCMIGNIPYSEISSLSFGWRVKKTPVLVKISLFGRYSKGFKEPGRKTFLNSSSCTLRSRWQHCNTLYNVNHRNRLAMILELVYLSTVFDNWQFQIKKGFQDANKSSIM